MKKNQKKKILLSAIAGLIAITPFALTGCSNGNENQKKTEGAQWYYDSVNVVDGKLIGDVGFNAVNGDFYIDIDDNILYHLKDNYWSIVMRNFGGEISQNNSVSIVSVEKTSTDGLVDTYTIVFSNGETSTFTITNGKDGKDGKDGLDGKDGVSVYVGYDGYVWQGAEKTSFKIENTTIDDTIVENTLGIYGNKYFSQNIVSTINPIALMGNYFPTIKKTGYSNTVVSEISFYSDKAGTLEIGTAKVADIVNARETGAVLSAKTSAYQVVQGINTISLNISIADSDTLVLGGGTSDIGMYSYEEINGEDEYGFYTVCDNQAKNELFEKTNNINDKLVVRVKAKALETINLVKDWDVVQSSVDVSKHSHCYISYMPFCYSDTSLFENHSITRLYVFVGDTVEGGESFEIDPTKTYTYTLSVISSDSVVVGGEYDILRSYQLEVKGSEIVQNSWYSFDLSDLNIKLSEGETLGFGGSTDTLHTNFYKNGIIGCSYLGYTGTDTTLSLRSKYSLLIGVEEGQEIPFTKHIESLYAEEQECILKNF